MPLQEFWNENPDLLWTYRTIYIDKTKNEIELQKEMINYKAWLQGLYNYNAIASALTKGAKYLEQPLELKEKSKEEKQLELTTKIKENAMRCKAVLEQRGEKEGMKVQH